MPRRTLTLATIAVTIAVGIGTRARAQELSCPSGYAPDPSNTRCVPSQPSAGSVPGGVAGQAQQLLNTFGEAVQGASQKATGAVGGMLNSFGLQGSAATPNEVAPNAGNGATAQGGSSNNFGNPANGVEPFVNNMGLLKGSSGAPKVGNSGTARGAGPCALLTADDVAAVLGEPVKGEVQQSYMREEAVTGGGMTDPGCKYVTADNMRMVFLTLPLHRGRAGFDETVQLDEAASKPGTLSYGSPELAAEMRQDNAARARMAPERLSGVGDKAYLVPGPQEVQVLVLKGNTFFDISTLDTNGAKESTSRWAVALARKVAARL